MSRSKGLFQTIKRRSNQHGSFYNVCFADDITSCPSLEAMQKALRAETKNKDIELRARSDARFDSSNRIWVDLYPKVEDPFAQRRLALEGGAA